MKNKGGVERGKKKKARGKVLPVKGGSHKVKKKKDKERECGGQQNRR